MKFRWILILGINAANSLYMAFILVTMFANRPHQILLIEPNNLIITGEAFASVFIATLTLLTITWSIWKNP